MTVVISMLRGVNVGGHNMIKMEALRALYESLGLLNVRTHIQSGNVIFGTRAKDMGTLGAKIENAIERTFGIRSHVILRTTGELKDVIARNPFAARPDVPPNKLVVTFLSGDPSSDVSGNIAKLQGCPEELHLSGRELFIHFPNGISGSKLPPTALDKAIRIPGTARNWNTVTKLLDLAEKWEAPVKN